VIRLGLRLTLDGGREAAVRLVITALAVAIGVGMLLIALAGMNGINAQNQRTAWLNTGATGPTPATTLAARGGPLWWMLTEDHFGSKPVYVVDVAAAGARAPWLPGLSRIPGPGQYAASPALTDLLRRVPASELGDRYQGREVATIGAAALPSPGSLIIVIGRTAAQMSRSPRAGEVPGVNTDASISGGVGLSSNRLETILAVGALALLFPVLVFISTATRLAAARREQRFAALRLVGATPRQVSVISAVESTVAAVGGVVLGFVLYFLARPEISSWAVTGQPFAPGDLSLRWLDVVLVAAGVPLAAAVAARVALRRVTISPLGVSRRAPSRPPRAYRLVPVAAGIGELLYFALAGHPKSTGAQIDVFFLGCLITMFGLVWAGPWMLMVGSRILARRAVRPAGLIAGRRIADNPRSAFRSISGVVIALFAMSTAVGIITTILADQGGPNRSSVDARTLVQQLSVGGPGGNSVTRPTGLTGAPERLTSKLRSVPGVTGVAMVYSTANGLNLLVSCRQLAATPALGRCQAGAAVGVINAELAQGSLTGNRSSLAKDIWPAAPVSLTALRRMPLDAAVVTTDGAVAAIEGARTILELTSPSAAPPATMGEISARQFSLIIELEQMIDVVIIASLVIGGCSLAVSVTAGVNDRRRPFSLLRLTGAPLRVLRSVIALEAAVPLVVIAALSSALGLLVAELFLRAQLSESLVAPHGGFYALIGSGLAVSLAVIACTLPLVARITGPEVARND
jgi:hypothetical protein